MTKMPHKSPNVPNPSPVHTLSQEVATAAKGKSSISISNNLTRAIVSELKTLRTSKSFVLDIVVNTVVSALDEHKGACSRVEPSAFAIILLILLHARYSRQKERGIIIFTASLHHDTHKAHSLRTIENRKAIIGEACILTLLSCFTNTHENVRVRRWVGIMLIQLLDNVDRNKLRFESCTEDSRRALGNMLSEEQDELLRITCGELLRALINWGINPEFLWPMDTNPQVCTNFPTSSLNEKHWNNAFQKYIDALVNEDFGTSEGSGTLYFAQALVLTPTGNMVSGDIINILLDSEISICTQTSDDTFPESLEIPFDLIVDANIEKTILEGVGSSAASAVDLVVNLKPSKDFLCYMNALPVQIGGFRITIGNENDARNMAEEITEPKRYKKASQSKEVITIGSELDRAASSKGLETEEDFYGEGGIKNHDPATSDWREEDKDEIEEVEFDNFIIQSPPSEKARESDGLINTEIGEPIIEDVTQAACNNLEDDAGRSKPLTSSKTAALSHNARNEPRSFVDKGKGREQAVSPKENISSCLNGEISSSPASPELPSAEGLEEGFESIADMSLLPVVPSQPKYTLESSQSKVKVKLKRIAPKPKAQKDLKRPKYTLKPKLAAPIAEAPPSKPVSAPKSSGVKAPTSNKTPKILKTNAASASKPTKVSKPKAIPKTIAGPSARSSRKVASKSKISRKLASKKASKPLTGRSPRETSEHAMNPLENELHSTNLDETNATNLEGATTVVSNSRLLPVFQDGLSDSGDGQFGAHSRDLNQAGVVDQPQQLAIQSENSRPYPIHQANSRILDDAHSMARNFQEQVGTLGCGSPSNKIEIQSESSPSPLSERLPIPLPPREMGITQPLTSDAAHNLSKTVTEPTNIRRSPHSDAYFRSKEAFAATNEVRTPARRPAYRQVSAERSQDKSRPKIRDLINKSFSRGDKPALVDERLARKPPLISFGAEGPRNQGIVNSKNSSLQTMRKTDEGERRGIGQTLTQSYTDLPQGKRKRREMDASEFGKSKRQQAARLQESNDEARIIDQELAINFGNEDDHSLQKIYPLTQSKRKFGSRGSRVDANGSPCGNEKTPKQLEAYEAVVRKALTHTKSPVKMVGYHISDNSNVEGFKIIESGLEITRNDSAKVSFELKSLPLLPPNEAVTDPRLPREKNAKLQISQVEAKEFYTSHDRVDPFLRPNQEENQDSLSKSLQYHRKTPLRKLRDVQTAPILQNAQQNITTDPEMTLVDVENIDPFQDCSSITDVTSESSDDNQNQTLDKTDLENFSQAEHDQWRMALKPYQKGILDVLNQISTDLVRHLINHEQVVDDVLTEYEQGGLKLMGNLNQSHQDNRRQVQLEFDEVVRSVGHEYGEARRVVSRIIEALKARRVRELEKAWMQEQAQVQGLLDEGLKQSM